MSAVSGATEHDVHAAQSDLNTATKEFEGVNLEPSSTGD